MASNDLLIEIGTEELPPKFLKTLSEDFCALVTAELSAEKLAFTSIKTFASPRRIALLIEGLITKQADYSVEKKGPPVSAAFKDNAPTQALIGFARANNTTIEQLSIDETPKGAWYIYNETVAGKSTTSLIPEIIEEALDKLPIAKRMRWGNHDFEFVRPIRWMVLLFGSDVIDATIMGVQSGNVTHGHRFHTTAPITIDAPKNYETILETKGYVIPDFNKRTQNILTQIEKATSAFGRPIIEEALLNEVTALVEWPVALIGAFEPRFLDVPQEALISTMQDNQKYFPIVDSNNQLIDHFCFISNIESSDPREVISGNERVIRPRFSDADFFWNTDKDTPLTSYLPRLKTTIFQTKLGSQADKMARVAILSEKIAQTIGADTAKVAQAAHLYKADLLSNMVQEFPELQGIMGRYYALHQGIDKTVAHALEEVYWPRFSGDKLPTSKEAEALAIAERIDTIVGIFAIGQIPSGSRDPYSLRRNALGVLRILIEHQHALDLKSLIDISIKSMPSELEASKVAPQVFQYIIDRMKAYSADLKVPSDTFEAVIDLNLSAPFDIYNRLLAVTEFRKLPQAERLIQSNKRIHNILQKNALDHQPVIDESLLHEAEEKALYSQLMALSATIKQLTIDQKYGEILSALTTLEIPLENFFEKVMVMCEDLKIRDNRLALLTLTNRYFKSVANISHLQ